MQFNSLVRNSVYKAVAISFFVFSLILFNSLTANAQALVVDVDDITDDPDKFVGKTVTVKAEVEEVIGTQIAIIEDEEVFQEEMLVLSATPLSSIVLTPVSENTDQTFTGVVRIFNAAELRQELGVNFDEDLVEKFNGKPVLVLGLQEAARTETTVIEEKTVTTEVPETTPEVEVEKEQTSEVVESPPVQTEQLPAQRFEQRTEQVEVAPVKPAKKRTRLAKD